MNLVKEVCKSFNTHARTYEQFALAEASFGEELINRLKYFKIDPKFILDLGGGTGIFSRKLKKLYPKAEVINCDIAQIMLTSSPKQIFKKTIKVNADMHKLPFASQSFDLIFANQVIHWAYDLPLLFEELSRVMNVDGCFIFSSLGPDTFKEIRHSFKGVDSFTHVNHFTDMHDVGDMLLRAKFVDPVMDMDHLQVNYSSVASLLKSLKKQGSRNVSQGRGSGLMGKNLLKKFQQNYEKLYQENDKYPLSYEVVYGQAWKGMQRKLGHGEETVIPISSIKKYKSSKI